MSEFWKEIKTQSAIPVDEQETVITFDRRGDKVFISTSDTTVMNKLEKLGYERVGVSYCDGKIAYVDYESPKKAISFRKIDTIGKPRRKKDDVE